MNKEEAYYKYSLKFDPWIWDEYKNADRYVYINVDDPDLQKFRIPLPKPPDWGLIKGFGLPANKQFFQYEVYPDRLRLLERTIRNEAMIQRKGESKFNFERKIYDELWRTLEDHPDEYRFEIEWIRKMWFYRERGQWQFIRGQPVYIDGWMHYYLNFWTLEQVGKPEYRDRDRKWFHAVRYAYTTTMAPEYNEDGSLILLSDGTPKMRDMGARTVFGINCLKGRRVGDTSKAESVSICEVTSNYEFYNGIQGNKESTANGIYNEKVLLAFKHIPFFFRPQMANFNIATGLNFSSPEFIGGLNSKMDFATTAKRHFYDSKKLNIIHLDEIGKTEGESVDRRNEVVKRCIAPGATIKGLMICTSTVDDFEQSSARDFFSLTKASHFENRGPNGQTKSGLLNIYFPIYESYEGFINQWGSGIIETPVNEEIPYMTRLVRNEKGKIMGCREYLDSEEEDIRNTGDIMRLLEFKRMTPRTFRDCFATAGRNQFFNTDKLETRLSFLQFSTEDKVRVGDMVWTAGFGSRVEFVDNPEGRFKVSMLPEPGHRSLMVTDGFSKRPMYKEIFIASADPYRVEKVEGYRMSLGSGAVLYMHDPNIDDESKEVRDYSTNRFCCTYLARPDSRDEYCEDMLKMSILYGALMYPEANIPVIADYFTRKGFEQYLCYSTDPETGKRKNNAGWTTAGPNIKAKMFNSASDWINLHSDRCDHPEILEEFLEIEGPDVMHNYDLFVALCGCLMAQESRYVDFVHGFDSSTVDITGWF